MTVKEHATAQDTTRPIGDASGAARKRQAIGQATGSAAEGGTGRFLVTTAVNSSTPAKRRARRVAADRAQTLIRQTCGHLKAAKRIVNCGRIPTGNGRPMIAKADGRAYASGLQTCGSVWSCVSCSFKIRMKRAIEIAFAVAVHLARGGGVLHVVVTMPHRADDPLADLWGMLSDCWGHVTSGGGWQTFRERHGVEGYIRAAEVTHGWRSGWHPHCHILLFVDKPMSPTVNSEAYYELRKAIRERWCKRMASKYGRTMSDEFGIRVEPVKADEAEGSGSYLTKVGYELAMVDTKVGRGEGHRTPFAIAYDAAETGDLADIELLREWVSASHRKRSITWSNGLRASFGLGVEKTDEELAAEDQDGETVAEFDPQLWKDISSRRDGARGRLLTAFETNDGHNGVHAAVSYLTSLGYAVKISHAGTIPVIGLHPPNNQPIKEQHHVEQQTHRRHETQVPVLRSR